MDRQRDSLVGTASVGQLHPDICHRKYMVFYIKCRAKFYDESSHCHFGEFKTRPVDDYWAK
jgi:hypothetical protein